MIKKLFFKRIIAILIIALFSLTSIANECKHLELGTPKQSDVVTCYLGYAIGYNNSLKSAEWVAYRLDKKALEGVKRQDRFKVDSHILPIFQTKPSDYVGSGYHKGHLANSASINQSVEANNETFVMSNIVPQLPMHNTGIWKGLENKERKLAESKNTVYVYAGVVFDEPITYIGDRVPVPSSFWKVVYSPSEQKAIAYFIPHDNLKADKLNLYITSIDKIENFTQMDLISSLPDEVENRVESEQLTSDYFFNLDKN